jgi:class 3 adenylate cyclase
MNLFFKSYCRYLIFFLIIAWESCIITGHAQGNNTYLTPWIQEIELPGTYREMANESFYLDHHGNLFLGKENGLAIIEGTETSQILMKGPVFVTGNNSDTLLYASAADVGYLVRRDRGEFSKLSRKHWIPASQRDFIPKGILLHHDHFFVNSNLGVLSFKGGSYRLHDFGGKKARIHCIKDLLFITLDDGSVLAWDGNNFSTPTDSQMQVVQTLPAPVVKTEGSKGSVFIGHLKDGLILAQEEERGLMVLHQSGQVINQLGSKQGLPDREIRQVIVRNDSEIWILAPHSLHKITYPSPLRLLDFKSFETGRILNSIMIGDTLYAGTSHGLFQICSSEDQTDRVLVELMMPENKESIHLLTVAEGQLFAAGITHLYAVDSMKAILLDDGFFTGISALDKNRVVAANRKGIFLYEKTPEGWRSGKLDSSLPSSFSFTQHQGQLFFICDNGVYRYRSDQNVVLPTSFHTEELLYRLIPMTDELLLVGSEKVYRYDKNENTFLPLPSGPKNRFVAYSDALIPEPSGSAWVVEHEGKYRSKVSHVSHLELSPEKHVTFPILQNIGEIINLNIHDSILYITGRDKISVLNLRTLRESVVHHPIHIEADLEEQARTGFYLAGLEFQSTPEPMFRYRLHPGQDSWTGWSPERTVIFNNLKHGEYILEVQAIDLYGRETSPSEFPFSIPPPIYSTWYAYLLYGMVLLFGLFLFRKWRLLSYRRAESRISERMQVKIDQMAREKARSDKFASEFLPDKTVAQLKSTGRAKWDKYERVTVLFSDIQGFTRIAEEMNPESLIDELDQFFFHFDSVVEKYNIEKIKTIGDAYMAAGGIPEKNSTNPVEVVLAALEMQSYMNQLKASKSNIWDLRIGIHTGSVIAGVVGHKKVSYDIWGDTVNTASRMESSGMPGKVNISGITYGMVKDYFICEFRGKLPVKYKGKIDMYFVKGLRPELSVDLKEIPNKRFFTKLQILRLGDIEEKVFEGILKDLPESIRFHHLEHARKVYNQSFMLSRAEEIEQEERLIVRTAALMLFTGITQSYANFENRSAIITRELLSRFKYSESQVDQICNLILSTKMPFQPNNKLEEIIIDARMEYLGRSDYPAQIKLLYQELRETGLKINGQQFKNQQLELLHEFEYFTTAGRRLREVTGPQQMASLEQERWI